MQSPQDESENPSGLPPYAENIYPSSTQGVFQCAACYYIPLYRVVHRAYGKYLDLVLKCGKGVNIFLLLSIM